ncbi:hypothetical protein ACFLRF_03305 [Candidatus Altiarchaeota archaeon]
MIEIMEADKILVLYSGGSDSTLAAAIAARKAKTVYLITYKRFGFFSPDLVSHNMHALEHKFPEVRFVSEIIDIESEYRDVAYSNHLGDLRKYGLITQSVCGLCKVAMHWRTIKECMKKGVHLVYDGAVESTNIFPAQNKRIMLDGLSGLYREHGITYENPVYDMDTQRMLFKEGIIPSDKYKGTSKDIQPVCSQQLLFTRFVDYYLAKHSFSEYEERVGEYYREKLDYVRGRLGDD